MTVAGFYLVQGKSTARGTLGTLLGTPQLLRLKGLPQYWKALHHCSLCMSYDLLIDLLIYTVCFISCTYKSSVIFFC